MLRGKYSKNIEFRSPDIPHATSRRVLFKHSNGKPYMAIDARKIFPTDATGS